MQELLLLFFFNRDYSLDAEYLSTMLHLRTCWLLFSSPLQAYSAQISFLLLNKCPFNYSAYRKLQEKRFQIQIFFLYRSISVIMLYSFLFLHNISKTFVNVQWKLKITVMKKKGIFCITENNSNWNSLSVLITQKHHFPDYSPLAALYANKIVVLRHQKPGLLFLYSQEIRSFIYFNKWFDF